MKILKLSDLWQNFMKNDNIFDIICEEGSKNQIWWRGRIERFSDSAMTYKNPHRFQYGVFHLLKDNYID